MTYSMRPMEKNDLGQVTDIDREAFPTQWPPANYTQELNNRLAHYIVLCDDSCTFLMPPTPPQKNIMSWLKPLLGRSVEPEADPEPVEMAYIIGFSGIWVMAEESHITNIAVRKEYQRRGFGEMLMLGTIDLSMELDAVIMTLEVRASNKSAQNLYLKYGFEKVGIRRGYYLDNREDAIIMTTESITSAAFKERIARLREALAEKMKISGE